MTTGSNGSNGEGGIEIRQAENCRFAYTLNNMQPVRCSIIGNEPLFFMDYDGALLDDEFADEAVCDAADPFGLGAIEQGVAALKEKIMRGGDPDGEACLRTESSRQEFMEQARQILMPGQASPKGQNEKRRIQALEKRLRTSRYVAALLDAAAAHGVTLGFSTQTEQAFYDRTAKAILLNAGRAETDMILLAMRELRRVWQHKNGALLHPLTFHPDQAILVNRAQHADLCAAMVRGAWELQLAGDKEPWERLERFSCDDLTRAFAREAYLDFRTLANGRAAGAVFEAWFLSDRCRHEDRLLIQNMLSDYQGYVFENERASRSVGADLIVALGSVPFGKNYLAPFVSTIMGDPLFAEVRDRSNANFLWFIKFERSFREAEQKLQPAAPTKDRAVPRGASITKERDGDDAKEATVLALPGRGYEGRAQPQLPAAERAAGPEGKQDGNVLYFHRAAHTLGRGG